MNEHELFEKWLSTTNHRLCGEWHDKEQRYTVMSTKQDWWEVWKARAELSTQMINIQTPLIS